MKLLVLIHQSLSGGDDVSCTFPVEVLNDPELHASMPGDLSPLEFLKSINGTAPYEDFDGDDIGEVEEAIVAIQDRAKKHPDFKVYYEGMAIDIPDHEAVKHVCMVNYMD